MKQTSFQEKRRWYQQFNQVISASMGGIVKQDQGYTLPVLHKLLEMFKAKWSQNEYDIPIKSISLVMFFLLMSLGGIIGFEALWMDLREIRYDLAYCEELEDKKGVSWMVVGWFKGER